MTQFTEQLLSAWKQRLNSRVVAQAKNLTHDKSLAGDIIILLKKKYKTLTFKNYDQVLCTLDDHKLIVQDLLPCYPN